jgi:hypothetical protein
MSDLLNALQTFFERLGTVEVVPLGLAVLCHLAKVLVRTYAWRNILAASYEGTTVRRRDVLSAYVAGTGANALLPARGGDALRLFLLRRRIDGASYPTLAATLLVETLFDAVVATALLLWALQLGVLPGLDVLPTLPSIDWLWLFQSPLLAALVGVALLVVGFVLGMVAARRIDRFRQRVARGFAILSFSVGMKLTLIVANVTAGALVLGLLLRTLRWRRVVERETVALEEQATGGA